MRQKQHTIRKSRCHRHFFFIVDSDQVNVANIDAGLANLGGGGWTLAQHVNRGNGLYYEDTTKDKDSFGTGSESSYEKKTREHPGNGGNSEGTKNRGPLQGAGVTEQVIKLEILLREVDKIKNRSA